MKLLPYNFLNQVDCFRCMNLCYIFIYEFIFIFIHQNASLLFSFVSKQLIILNHISLCGKRYLELFTTDEGLILTKDDHPRHMLRRKGVP